MVLIYNIIYFEIGRNVKLMNDNENNELEQDVNHLIQIRKEKLNELIENGKNPFEITKFNRTIQQEK